MKNKFTNLNNHLFEQLERLNDDDLEGEKLQQEIARAQAMAGIARQIVCNANLVLNAKKIMLEHGVNGKAAMPEFFDDKPRLGVIDGNSKKTG